MANLKCVLIVAFVLVDAAVPTVVPAVSEEESVVSVYTTQPTTSGISSQTLDVYQQIADNIAEKLTRPINNFLGIGSAKKSEPPNKRFQNLETFDETEEDPKSIIPVDNDLTNTRDVEELSDDVYRSDVKPEKINLLHSILKTLYTKGYDETTTTNPERQYDDDDGFSLNDEKAITPQSVFVSFIEWIASAIQITSGAFDAIFNRPKDDWNEEDNIPKLFTPDNPDDPNDKTLLKTK